MSSEANEEELLRSVALQNARTILLARERAEKARWRLKMNSSERTRNF